MMQIQTAVPIKYIERDLNDNIDPDKVQVGENQNERFLNEIQNLSSKRERKPSRKIIETAELNYAYMTSLITETDETKNVMDALNDPNWVTAMESEMKSLKENETWDLVPRPSGVNIVGSRWVFKIKRNSDGSIQRYKSRLVAQGYTHVEGVDYNEVYSPVARFSAIRSLLAVAKANDYEIHQMDVATAFLNGTLDYEIYMEQPIGFVDPDRPDWVCKLKKSIYGLKQSARCWNTTLDEYLTKEGYKKSEAEDCIYTKFEPHGKLIILAVYVDDVIPISNCTRRLAQEKYKLKSKFKMVDNGNVHHLLGMLISRDRAGIFFVLIDFKMDSILLPRPEIRIPRFSN